MREPVGPITRHNSGQYGYQYSNGITVLNTSKQTAEMMAMYADVEMFTMSKWKLFRNGNYGRNK